MYCSLLWLWFHVVVGILLAFPALIQQRFHDPHIIAAGVPFTTAHVIGVEAAVEQDVRQQDAAQAQHLRPPIPTNKLTKPPLPLNGTDALPRMAMDEHRACNVARHRGAAVVGGVGAIDGTVELLNVREHIIKRWIGDECGVLHG